MPAAIQVQGTCPGAESSGTRLAIDTRMKGRMKAFDVVIAGAGPAGLSAALILGRARRSVLICDVDQPRSWASKAMHGFITREGMHPRAFRERAQREIASYPSVELRSAEVTGASPSERGFTVLLDSRARIQCRK